MDTLGNTTDLYLLGDMTPDCRECSGFLALACRLIRCLQTPTGFFPWWPLWGLDIRKYSLSKVPPWQIADDVDKALSRDEQVKNVLVTPAVTDQGRTINLSVLVQSEVGNFTFTMSANEAAATLLTLQKSS